MLTDEHLQLEQLTASRRTVLERTRVAELRTPRAPPAHPTETIVGRDYLRQHDLMIEYRNFRSPRHCPHGVYVVPSPTNVYEWHGFVVVDAGYFRGGVFRFIIHIPRDYPDSMPSVEFTNKELVHPLVDPSSGQLELRNMFATWKPRTHRLCHVAQYIRNVFLESVLLNLSEGYISNKEAHNEFEFNRQSFAEAAVRTAVLSVRAAQDLTDTPLNLQSLSETENEAADALVKQYVRLSLL